MPRYIIDSSAWIEYLDGSTKGAEVKEIIEKNECFTSSLSIAEVTIKILKSDMDPQDAYATMTMLSRELPVTSEIAYAAGRLYVEERKRIKDIGIVDVFIMVHAKKNNLVILTGDVNHFKERKNVHLIK
jgi:predicted nucleic acid-binding protein